MQQVSNVKKQPDDTFFKHPHREDNDAHQRPARPFRPREFLPPSTHLAQHARGESPSRIVKTAKGVFIEDRDGKKLLDAFGGLYCVNVGYGQESIIEAIADQAKELAYYHAYAGHGTEAAINLAKMVIDRAPEHMSKVYFGLSGSDANETNIKLVWYYNNILGRPEKKKIISRWRGYHGSGLMTGSLTGLPASRESLTCRWKGCSTPPHPFISAARTLP
nr:aminotransferase class III-fold pyridoxal phosphate-dependent enzyme [Marinicella sp. W31]MDC2879045.1 aminotransferase class III-fold pyridoxal phosphate-dependent enzyme [Marinicella sp. W31]